MDTPTGTDERPRGPGTTGTPEALSDRAAISLQGSLLKVVLIAGIVLAVVLGIHLSPLRAYLKDIQKVKQLLAEAGAWAPVLSITVGGVAVAVGFPRTIFSVACGMFFGFMWGAVIGHAAAMLGTCMAFYGARACNSEWLAAHLRNKRALSFLNREPSVFAVIMVRQLPVPGLAQNICLALTRARHGVFLLGSIVGMLPASILFSLVGAGIGKESMVKALVPLASALVGAAAGLAWFRHHRKQASHKEAEGDI